MSKYRYLSVEACFSTSFHADVKLPDDWDMMSVDERVFYVKAAAEEQMLGGVADDAHEYAKMFRHLTASDLQEWSVRGTALHEVADKPLVQLVLAGTYDYDDYIDWDDDDDDED